MIQLGDVVKFYHRSRTFEGELVGTVVKVSSQKNVHIQVVDAPDKRKKPYIKRTLNVEKIDL